MKIIFCLPGNNFSIGYFNCWNNTVAYLNSKGIESRYSMSYSPIVASTRNSILLGSNHKDFTKKPFNSLIDYDYLFWIDSDIIWRPEQILDLINHDKDVVSGCYISTDTKNYPICKKMDDDYLLNNGNYKLMSRDDMNLEKDLFTADFVGFGFVVIKKGVFEAMDYPWFEIPTRTVGHITDLTSEDVNWCMKVRDKGYEIHVDPNCKVGHEKKIVLS